VAGAYELTHEREYWAVRSSAGLFDITPLFKYRIGGPDAQRLLDRVVTRDVARCDVGQVVYTSWCDDYGKVMDDGTVSRLGDSVFRLTAAEPNLHWLHRNARGMNVTIDDESDTMAALALQGPAARTILNAACNEDLSALRFFRLATATIGGVAVTVSRTGYTGDLGYEIWIPAAAAKPVWDALMRAGRPHGITPTGLQALDMVRIEAGLILIDVDYVPARRAIVDSRKSSPYELGLGWTVRLGKEFFVGKDALEAEWQRGATWMLRGLAIDWESLEEVHREFRLPPQLPTAAWRTSVPVYAVGMGRQVGYGTSGCWSPLLKNYIVLAHLEARFAHPGTELAIEITVEHRRRRARARVVETPFFNPERKRG
jgi:aminomethyltransferase